MHAPSKSLRATPEPKNQAQKPRLSERIAQRSKGERRMAGFRLGLLLNLLVLGGTWALQRAFDSGPSVLEQFGLIQFLYLGPILYWQKRSGKRDEARGMLLLIASTLLLYLLFAGLLYAVSL